MQVVRVKVEGGYLLAKANRDPNYPGIDVEFVPDKQPAGDDVLSLPRVLMEKPCGESLRALVWADSGSEDYTKEIKFN